MGSLINLLRVKAERVANVSVPSRGNGFLNENDFEEMVFNPGFRPLAGQWVP